jgi:Holliday junction resolvase RusA-like endonuclease
MTMTAPTTDAPRTRRKPSAAADPVTVLDLPAPPGVNHIWRYRSGRAYRSPIYTDWIEHAGWELQSQRPTPVSSPVRVLVRLGKPDRKRDADGYLKALLDLLESHGVIENDVEVANLHVIRDADVQMGRVTVELSQEKRPGWVYDPVPPRRRKAAA